MAFHTVGDNNGAPTIIATLIGVANAAGSGSGDPVSTSVSLTDAFGNGRLPSNLGYVVHVEASQSAFVTITGKSTTGFSVVLTPPSGVTLSAGTFNVAVVA